MACESIAGRSAGVRVLGRMLEEFNRGNVIPYWPAFPGTDGAVSEFRRFAQKTIDKALRGILRGPVTECSECMIPIAMIDVMAHRLSPG